MVEVSVSQCKSKRRDTPGGGSRVAFFKVLFACAIWEVLSLNRFHFHGSTATF